MSRNHKIPRVHKHTLIEMNMAAFLARRDAAFAWVADLLRQVIPHSRMQRRRDLYIQCTALLNEAVSATQRSQNQPETPVVRYLQLLRDTVGGCLAIVQHEVNLGRGVGELSRLVGTDLSEPLHKTDHTLSSSEANVRECVVELLTFGISLLDKDSRERMSAFSEADLRRYTLAREEYDAHYRRLPAEPEPKGT